MTEWGGGLILGRNCVTPDMNAPLGAVHKLRNTIRFLGEGLVLCFMAGHNLQSIEVLRRREGSINVKNCVLLFINSPLILLSANNNKLSF